MKCIQKYLLTAALVTTLAASACSSKSASSELEDSSLAQQVSTLDLQKQATSTVEPASKQPTSTSNAAPTQAAFPVDDKRNAVVYVKQSLKEITVYSEPSQSSSVVTTLTSITENDGPRVFLATDPTTKLNEGWIKVALPIRPNGSQGWIQKEQVDLYDNEYRIEIDRTQHQLTLVKNGEVEQTHTVAIGIGATPTPVGTFYTIELLQDPDGDKSAYGPYAFGLSGFSETLQSFNGGNGVIGIHGTNDPSSIGKNVSHGCVRLPNDVISAMAQEVPLGTPVVIT